MKSYIILFALIIYSFIGYCNVSKDSAINKRTEIILNISRALSGFTKGGTSNILNDPYLFAIKKVNTKGEGAWRFGLNYNLRHTETFTAIDIRTSDEQYYSPIVGYEWRRNMNKNFTFYYGFDTKIIFGIEKTSSFSGGIGSTINIDGYNYGIGVGPICGFAYHLNNYISIYTEGSAFLTGSKLIRNLTINGSNKSNLENSNSIFLQPFMPTCIFIAIKI